MTRKEAALLLCCCACVGPADTGFVRADGATNQNLRAVHGSSATDVWAVGEVGTITHFDGTRWSVSPTGVGVHLNAVFALAPDDAWAVGDKGTVLRWNGQHWSPLDAPTSEDVLDVWASGPSDVWVLPRGDTGAYHLLRWDGTRWRTHPYADSYTSVVHLWGAGPEDVWLASDSYETSMWRTQSGEFVSVRFDISDEVSIEDLDGSGPDDVWAVTDDQVLRFDAAASAWKPFLPAASENLIFKAVWSSSPTDVWVAGELGLVQHFDGTAWSPEASIDLMTNVKDLWGSGPDDLWAVGKGGAIFRRTPPVVSR